MSVLLLGLDEQRGPAFIRRLLDEGDVVGVVEEDPARAAQWKRAGAHVASGSPADADLIERAAQHARSIVVSLSERGASEAVVAAVLEAGRLAPEAPRIIVAGSPSSEIEEMLRGSAFDYVILRLPARRVLRRVPVLPPEDLAEAINAADDLAGSPRLDLDLTSEPGWERLGLAAR